MGKILSVEDIKYFLSTQNISKRKFAKDLGISRTHLDKLLSEKCTVGVRTYQKLDRYFKKFELDIEMFLLPTEIVLGDKIVRCINITNESNELIASITSSNIIERDGYKVECK
ncbi:helix-turn-helix transcriptional regulator [Peptostreptococcus canis]|uniref:HTH cro/C1-type domain-containing protein n=1 Tax=Peptostreptococcus canis TaxID=1159213 RepID=A0ABR6TIF8_9FIRM|nr:helix-turn-helix transcriptional regulator [Peptostreptococcus canis]MBC2575196.1 hypothetical protein [Peptostreptococcus canis]MBP1997629.1 transcriptional regulator with XRE-family HTH domain [Peptostreptococcus canis]